jgi:hypothetical protein
MPILNEFEVRWIAYARKVLAQNCGCVCDRDEIAWPGYIGPNYAAGRVLIFGAIHEIDVLRMSGVYDVVPAVKDWFSNQATNDFEDRAYLDRIFDAYKAAIPKWLRYVNKDGKEVRGVVWGHIETVVSRLGLDYSQIAFTNLAKCGIPSGSVDSRRTKKHEAATPAMELIRAIRPKYVIVASDNSDVRRDVKFERDGNHFAFRQCANLTFKSGSQRRDEWLRDDVRAYRNLMMIDN